MLCSLCLTGLLSPCSSTRDNAVGKKKKKKKKGDKKLPVEHLNFKNSIE